MLDTNTDEIVASFESISFKFNMAGVNFGWDFFSCGFLSIDFGYG